MATIDEAMVAAMRYHEAGRLAEAENIYRQVLAAMPGHAEALHLMGLLAGQKGQGAAGVEMIRAAIAGAAAHGITADRVARYWNNLGFVLLGLGRNEDAIHAYREALRLDPGYADAWGNLCHALRVAGDVAEAVTAGRQAVRLGNSGRHWMSLGAALAQQGGRQGLAEAIGAFQHALLMLPEDADVEINLAYALREAGRIAESVQLCRQLAARRPDDARAWKDLGLGLAELGRTDEAIETYRQALALPDGKQLAEVWSALGYALMARGEIAEAVAILEQGVAAHPGLAWMHSNLLYALHLDPRVDGRKLFAAHQEWERRHALPLSRFPHDPPRDPDKRLRIGYMSADFRDHALGGFMLAVVRERVRRGEMDLVLYSDARFEDEISDKFRRVVETGGGLWRGISGMTDQAAAELVRQDGVDVLVDLSMHAGQNRMLVFARQSAPVQVTYLAYPGMTGMRAIDWRLSDRFMDVPAREETVADDAPLEGLYAEKTWRLRSYWCYAGPVVTAGPEVGGLPAATSGVVTYGCLNNFTKVNHGVVDVWGRALRETDRRGIQSRLILHAKEGSHRDRVLEQLASFGVTRERVEFVGWMTRETYLATYGRIDVGLDPFPYCGGTTTCDALWMGVPVVTLRAGPQMPAVGRGGASILSNVGLTELVAENADEYVRIAADLAGDLGRLAALRAAMRDRMRRSPLMDVTGFVRELEQAYRGMWRRR